MTGAINRRGFLATSAALGAGLAMAGRSRRVFREGDLTQGPAR